MKSIKYGVRAVLFLILVVTSVEAQESRSAYVPDIGYVDALVEKASVLKLYDDPYWLRLLHYKRGITGKRSLVDDSAFFLSPDGKRFPDKELEATIRAFFMPEHPEKTHAGVKFIARFNWLNQKLKIDMSKLPMDFIAKFDKFYKSIDPVKAILTFPAGYINSPASMYGHTLLIFEPKNGNRLVSLAVNYAARTDENFGPTFAVKGLFGLYDGFYSILPYYEKINEYSSGEMRDMWEYTLNLNEEELKRLMMHIVEMEKIGSRYYFLDENCSYNLLLLLEVARPEVTLSSHLNTTVEPIDTIRVVIDEKMVLKREYRPSLYAQILQKKEFLSGNELDAIVRFANGDINGDTLSAEALAGSNAACMFDLTSDYLKFLAVKGLISEENYRTRILEVLKKRSKLTQSQSCSDVFTPPPPPDLAHRSNKVSVSYGSYASQKFVEVAYRPSCHDLIDSDLGLAKNTEIVFGNASARYYAETKKIKFQRFDLLKIKALPPSNIFYKPNCFMAYAGLKQSPVPDQKDSLAGYLDFGGGYSYSFGNPFHVYALFKTDTTYSGKYRYNSLFAFGGHLGVISDIGDVWKSYVYGEALYVAWGEKTPVYRVCVQERMKISSYVSITGEYKREFIFKRTTNEVTGSFLLLF